VSFGRDLVPAVLCLVGVILFLIASSRLQKVSPIAKDPLKLSGLSTRERREVYSTLLRRTLPVDPRKRNLAFESAEYVARTGYSSLLLNSFLSLGLILALCGLYLLPSISNLAVVAQAVVVVVGIFLDLSDWRRVRNSRELVRTRTFDSSSQA
jgi:hypothetical protein